MAKALLPSRIVCTKEFYDKHLAKNHKIVDMFMRININSKEHKKNHVVISRKDFELILKENKPVAEYPEILMAALKRIDEPVDIEVETDCISRAVEYAIYLSTITPFNTLILTTEEKVAKYEGNERFNNVKNERFKNIREVKVKTDDEALTIIEDFYEKCMDKEYY